MNPFFHAFQIGWNWYYLIAIAMFALVVRLSWRIPYVDDKRQIRCDQRAKRTAANVRTVASCLVAIMLPCESFRGIVQCLNNRPGAIPECPVFTAVLIVIALIVFYAGVIDSAIIVTEWTRVEALREKTNKVFIVLIIIIGTPTIFLWKVYQGFHNLVTSSKDANQPKQKPEQKQNS